jgi:hypothetical protein
VYPSVLTETQTSILSPSNLNILFLTLEKVASTALESLVSFRVSDLKKRKSPMVLGIRLMMQRIVDKQATSATQAKSKEYYNSHFLQQSSNSAVNLLAQVAKLEELAKASMRQTQIQPVELSLKNEEIETAEEEMKRYQKSRENDEKGGNPDLKDTTKMRPVGKDLGRKLDLRDMDKRLKELTTRHHALRVPGKMEATELLLSIKKERLSMIRPLHISPSLPFLPRSPVRSLKSSPRTVFPLADSVKRSIPMVRLRAASPPLSTRSTSKDTVLASPSRDHTSRLRRLAGLATSE